MTQTGDELTYYVVFQNSENLSYPWRFFTRKGFEHCSVLVAVEGAVMDINQSMYGIRFWVYPANMDIVLNEILKNPEFTVLEVKTNSLLPYRNKLGTMIPTCVSLTQRITGLTSHAFTPYGYYKHLLKAGAKIMGGKPKVDNSALIEQKRLADEAKAREETEKKRIEDLQKRQRLGRRSLLGTDGNELGVM